MRQSILAGALAVLAVVPASVNAQAKTRVAAFDRTVVPPAGKTPELRVPAWTKSTLPDGAELIVSEKHGLPLVAFDISFVGGANQYEPANETGLASLTSAMLSEGTASRTGDQISDALQALGTTIQVSVAGESGRISFQSTTDKFAPTLAILADMLEHPSIPSAALERRRASTLVALTQSRDRTGGIAAVVFPKVIYTTDSPLGRTATEASIKAITRDDVVKFANSYFSPGHAIITVVGDVNAADVRRTVERTLAAWTGGSMPAFNYPTPPAAKSTTIYLVDKPGAAQSTFSIGFAGPPRANPDYYAIRVMNEMLGGLFQSRLNHNIREVKGYSYGVGSSFAYGRGPGAFRAGGEIVTAKSDSALIQFMKELRDIRGSNPPSDDEMQQAKASLVQSLPSSFESVGGVNSAISSIYTQGLPEDYYQQFARAVNAVTRDDVVRVAQKYIDPDHLDIVIVGDRSRIEAPLAATKIAPIVLLDPSGDPVGGGKP
ncbi:MAG TPA: pitrilysin family protein [Gemmatimonadaceae bacterium]|jgi:predicted Zn-dependent peptidase